jgi:glutathione peroxidase
MESCRIASTAFGLVLVAALAAEESGCKTPPKADGQAESTAATANAPAANAPATTAATGASAAVPKTASFYDFSVKKLDGSPAPLAAYKGKVALVVNVASECGYTPQYAGLETLYEEMSPKGFVILGFPSNEFGEQEPGTPEQIAAFAASTYHVTFPLFEKVKTNGADASPVYALLSSGGGGPPKWNFHKYVVDKKGNVVRLFPSKVTPESAELREAIRAALDAT